MYVVKGGKEKGEEERNTTSYANSIQVSEETWESTHSEKRKKERKPQAMGKKKPSMRTSKEKKKRGPPATESRPSAPRWGDVPRAENCRKKLHEGFGCVLWTYYLGSSRLVISILLRLVNNLFVRDLWSEHYWATMASCAL